MDTDSLRRLPGTYVVDAGGQTLGAVQDVYQPSEGAPFATVRLQAGAAPSFFPVTGAEVRDGVLVVPYALADIAAAPGVADPERLAPDEHARLSAHYGLGGRPDAAAMTRCEEQLRVGTERVEGGRAVLRKHVVTETETRTVEVSRETVRVDREPLSAADLAVGSVPLVLQEQEVEVVLMGEQPVVHRDVVPVERVSVGTQSVTEQVEVSEPVRKEVVEVLETGAEDRTETVSELVLEPRRTTGEDGMQTPDEIVFEPGRRTADESGTVSEIVFEPRREAADDGTQTASQIVFEPGRSAAGSEDGTETVTELVVEPRR